MMQAAGVSFPQYGFEQHAGYATEVHRAAITDHGPCAIHRMSFSPFRLPSEEIAPHPDPLPASGERGR